MAQLRSKKLFTTIGVVLILAGLYLISVTGKNDSIRKFTKRESPLAKIEKSQNLQEIDEMDAKSYLYVNPHNFNYTINPGFKICGGAKNRDVLLLAFVPVSPDGFQNRLAVRTTWAVRNLFPKLRLVFLVGHSSDAKVNKLIKEESKTYGDIVQEDFIDTYRNLTIKTMMGMKWVAKYCSNAKYVLKVDDDVVVNSVYLMNFLDDLTAKSPKLKNSLICHYYGDAQALKVDRSLTSKFYMSFSDVPQEYYDPYCDGPAYMFTSDLAKSFYLTSLNMTNFVFEDVYVGVLAKKLNSSFVELNGHYSREKQRLFEYASYADLDKILFLFTSSNSEIKRAWDILLKRVFQFKL